MKDKKLFLILGVLGIFLVFVLVVLPKLSSGNNTQDGDQVPKDMVFETLEAYETAMETKQILRPTRDENWIYNIYEDHIEIAQYIGAATSVTVPSELSSGTDTTLPVYSILSDAFKGSVAENVVISPGIIDICNGAFAESNVVNVSVPKTTLRIGDSAFNGCKNLERIKLGDNISVIGLSAFSGCTNLKIINAPKNIISYGELCFSGCESLVYLEIGGVEIIPNSMCLNCTNLSIVIIKEQSMPTDLTEEEMSTWSPSRTIEDYAFNNCGSLTSLYIPNDITSIGEIMSFEEGVNENLLQSLTISGYISSTAALYAAQNKINFMPVDLDEFEANGNVVIKIKTTLDKIISKYERVNGNQAPYIPNAYSKDFFNEVLEFSDGLVNKKAIKNYTVTNSEYSVTLVNGQTFSIPLNVSTVVEEESVTEEVVETASSAENGEIKNG